MADATAFTKQEWLTIQRALVLSQSSMERLAERTELPSLKEALGYEIRAVADLKAKCAKAAG